MSEQSEDGARTQAGSAVDSLTATAAKQRAPHSPGPWTFENRNGERWVRDAKDNALMCDTTYYPPWCPSDDPDWHLIAAAPDLLAAAKRMRCGCTMSEIDSGHLVDCHMPELDAAIAKAEGR